MQLNDIFIYALRELNGFDDNAIDKAVHLANNDVVENVEEFIDFINFNIEEGKFPLIKQPFSERTIRKAIEKVKSEEDQMIHRVNVIDGEYPQKLLQSQIGALSTLAYKGNLSNLDRKTIMITGTSSVTTNAKFASKYFGRLFASAGYNILTSFSEGCEQCSIDGCIEAQGLSSFFLPHCINHLSAKELQVIKPELETGRSTLISAHTNITSNVDTIDDSYRYLAALADCLIIPQISHDDNVMRLVQKCLAANKPVFLIRYKTGNGKEYDCTRMLELQKIRYLSSNTALLQVKNVIGEA